MQTILDFIVEQPLEYLIAAGGLVAVILILVVTSAIRRRRFVARVEQFLVIPGGPDPADYFSNAELLRRSRLLEKLAERDGPDILPRLGMDQLWTDRLQTSSRPADFRRVLAYGTQRGLFACFLTALHNKRLALQLRSYLEEHSDFLVLRRLARSGRGEAFSGRDARTFFLDRVDEIREMAGDPEWPSRYFAVKILLHDESERSDRALIDAFQAPHPLVRKTLAEEYAHGDRSANYARLADLFLHDPVFEVREAARRRIRADFKDLYTLDARALEPEEALHVVELLDPDESNDVNAALELLAGNDRELRLAAARFLANSGTLRRMLAAVNFADMEEFERVRTLVDHAVDVHVADFVGESVEDLAPASLLLVSEILAQHGPQELIYEIAERVFRLQVETTDNHEKIYAAAARAVAARGGEDSLRTLARELARRADQHHLLSIVLSSIPAGHDNVFRGPLTEALTNADYPRRAEVRAAFARLDTPYVLSTCLGIITSPREQNPHRVRIDALLALGELKLNYAIQDILEHLPILPVKEAREFTKTLAEFQPKELERKAGMLLDSVDGNIRAAMIAALPATGKKAFLPKIKNALADADPDVRIAAAWSLVDYEETRALSSAVDLLRDPVERVRAGVARAIAKGAGPSGLDALGQTLLDENEVDVVKKAAIQGLEESEQPKSVDLLISVLSEEAELSAEAELALARKSNTSSIRRLVEQFKDADPVLRDRITAVFKTMGQIGEQVIRDVLEEDIASLREYLAEILEHTGYVESRIRQLSHRDPRVRRDAASFLSLVGSEAAFRGIVMAARDPDSDVRVQVTKALERLATPDGEEILRSLENDPDRRIRKYTHWAMERLAAKAL
jgi:HEAT repeat protein